MNFKSELFNINKKLAAKGIRLRIEQRGNRLGLRGPLPCKRNPLITRDQRISLGLENTQQGLEKAEKTLNFLYLQVEHNQFNWSNWSQKKSANNKFSDIAKEIEGFKEFFFNDPIRKRSQAGCKTTWDSAYLPYLNRLKFIAQKNHLSLSENLLVETLSSYSQSSRSRQQCGTTLNSFAKYLNIQLPNNWRAISYGYGLNRAQFRKLPTDKFIEEIYEMIPNQKWKIVYGLMATYGLRNHEVFFCDLSSLKEGEDRILRVLQNTKTGEHQVWPFHPQWIDKFQLNGISNESNSLPKINTDLTKTTLQNVGRRVSEQFRRYNLPFTPYDLRHAWAIRTIHIGLPDSVSARMMGHSVAIHTKTYHHWITRRDQQQAVDKALKRETL